MRLFRCMISIIFRDLVSLQVSSVYPGATTVWDFFFFKKGVLSQADEGAIPVQTTCLSFFS